VDDLGRMTEAAKRAAREGWLAALAYARSNRTWLVYQEHEDAGTYFESEDEARAAIAKYLGETDQLYAGFEDIDSCAPPRLFVSVDENGPE
jgi:hypothetical protein